MSGYISKTMCCLWQLVDDLNYRSLQRMRMILNDTLTHGLSSLPLQLIFSPSVVLKWTEDALPPLHVSTSNTSFCDVETSVISQQILLKLDFLPLLTDFTSSQTKRTYFRRRNMKQREARGCVWGQRSLGSIVEPESARAASLRAGGAPNQELLCGVTDSAQPPVVGPVG